MPDDKQRNKRKLPNLIFYLCSLLFSEICLHQYQPFVFVLTPSVEEEEDDNDPHDEDEAHEHEVPRVPEVSGGHPPLGPGRYVSGEHHGGTQQLGHSVPITGNVIFIANVLDI